MSPIVEPSYRGNRRLIWIVLVVVAVMLLLSKNSWLTVIAVVILVACAVWEIWTRRESGS